MICSTTSRSPQNYLGIFGLRRVLWIIKAPMKPRTQVKFWRIYACDWKKKGSINLLSRLLVIERRRGAGFFMERKISYKIRRGVRKLEVYCVCTLYTHFVLLIFYFKLLLKSFLPQKRSENLEGKKAFFFYVKNDYAAGVAVRGCTLGWCIDKTVCSHAHERWQ